MNQMKKESFLRGVIRSFYKLSESLLRHYVVNNFKFLLVILLLVFGRAVFAAELDNEEVLKEIANNISDEYVTCGSFFAVVSNATKKSKEEELSAKYEKAMNTAIEFALLSAKTGRSKEMAQKVTLARLEMTINEMKETIEGDYSNMSLLLNKYAKRCQWVMGNTEEFVAEWREKILRKHGK